MGNEENSNKDVNDQSNAQNATGVDSNENQNQNSETTNVNQNNDKTFTQSQVNQMMANEKRQGKESVYRELGIDPKDEKQIAMFKAFIDAQNANIPTEEQLAKSEAKFVEAEQRAIIAEVKVELMKLGAQPQYIDDIVTLASSKIGNAEDADLKSIVSEFKTKYPVWFTSDDTQNNTTGSKGTGSSVSNANSSKGGNETSIGSRLAAQKRESNKTSNSFWNK